MWWLWSWSNELTAQFTSLLHLDSVTQHSAESIMPEQSLFCWHNTLCSFVPICPSWEAISYLNLLVVYIDLGDFFEHKSAWSKALALAVAKVRKLAVDGHVIC